MIPEPDIIRASSRPGRGHRTARGNRARDYTHGHKRRSDEARAEQAAKDFRAATLDVLAALVAAGQSTDSARRRKDADAK